MKKVPNLLKEALKTEQLGLGQIILHGVAALTYVYLGNIYRPTDRNVFARITRMKGWLQEEANRLIQAQVL